MTIKKQIEYIKANKEVLFKNDDFVKNVLPQTYYKEKLKELVGEQMKKYQNMTKEQLIEVIKEKNETIARINGEMYYLKKWHEDYRHKKQALYAKIQAEREAKNGK